MARRKDRGLKNLIANLKAMRGREIQVGIFGDRAKRSSTGSKADSLAYRYRVHDKGLGNNPKRETLKPALEEAISNDPVVVDAVTKRLDKKRPSFTLNQAGQRLANAVKEEITDLRSPKKKEETIKSAQRRYGGSRRTNPLIQTAEMRNAVRHRIK